MGLSISASAAIIFVASVIVFGSILGAVDKAGQSIVDGQQTSADRLGDASLTRFTITSVDVANGTISAINEGSTTLSLLDLDLFINGSLSNDRIITQTVDGHTGTEIWLPREELVVQVSGDLTGAAVKLVAGNGISAYA